MNLIKKTLLFIIGASILLVVFLLAGARANAAYTWWSLGDTKYYSFSEFEKAWNKQITDEVSKEYDLLLLRSPSYEEVQSWLAVYREDAQLSNKKKLADMYVELSASQERKDYLAWRQEAKGVLLRANCSMPNDQTLTGLAREGKWRSDNSLDKLGATPKDCHYPVNKTGRAIPITLMVILLLVLSFALIFRTKDWKIIKLLNATHAHLYLIAVTLLLPVNYYSNPTAVVMLDFLIVGAFCIHYFVEAIKKKRKNLIQRVIRIVLSLFWVLALGAAMLFATFYLLDSSQRVFGKRFIVSGASMEPTLKSNQFVSITQYGKELPHRGDIIVLHKPVSENKDDESNIFIKRIVGMPNELIEVKDGSVWANGDRLDESYLIEQGKTFGDLTIRLRDNEYFSLGDNRMHSGDSREFGPIILSDIIGKVRQSLAMGFYE